MTKADRALAKARLWTTTAGLLPTGGVYISLAATALEDLTDQELAIGLMDLTGRSFYSRRQAIEEIVRQLERETTPPEDVT